jgi:uroporphyrinogen-III synthase
MKLLVTRPVEDAQPLAEKLEGLGHEAIIVPLLEIKSRQNIVLPDQKFQAVCVSSANGLSAKADLSVFHHIPFFAIGPQSAIEARRQGFDHVHDKGGNVEGLVQTICKSLKPENGPVLYLSGSETTGDLEGKLKSHGFAVSRAIVYDAVSCAVADLPSLMADADGVLLYSPRTTKLWVAQVQNSKLEERARILRHFCLSANVAANLPLGWAKSVSKTPDEFGMLGLLDEFDGSEFR